MEADEVTLFPTKGFSKTAVKIRIPVPVYGRICQAARSYQKCGLLSSVLAQLFLFGYDYVEKTFGVEALIAEVYKMRKSEKAKKGMGESRDA
jgi:hypothetical protein